MSQFYTATDHFSIIPALMLALFGCAILLFDAFDAFFFSGPRQRRWLLFFVVLGEIGCGVGLYRQQAYLSAIRPGGAGRLPGLGYGGRFRHLL